MSIKDNLLKTQKAVANDIGNGNALELADKLREAAIAAITNGMKSKEWKQYMALFCDNPNELAQLTTVRNTDRNYMPQMRTYIAATAVCLPDTNTDIAGAVSEDVEPPAGSVAPNGAEAPSAVRDNALAARLRQV